MSAGRQAVAGLMAFRGHEGCRTKPTGKVPSVRAEPDCIFRGIVAGEIPSTTIAQSERAIVFMDINPVTPGHALVVPRAHATDVFDVAADDLAASMHLARQIAERATAGERLPRPRGAGPARGARSRTGEMLDLREVEILSEIAAGSSRREAPRNLTSP